MAPRDPVSLHEERIGDLEDELKAMSKSILPYIQEIRTTLAYMGGDLTQVCQDVKSLQQESENGRLSDFTRDARLVRLESEAQDRRAVYKGALKWALGVAGTVIGTLLLIKFGIKP